LLPVDAELTRRNQSIPALMTGEHPPANAIARRFLQGMNRAEELQRMLADMTRDDAPR
jgi:hypothetical protein